MAWSLASVAKLPVLMIDANPKQIERGMKYISVLMDKDILKGKSTENDKTEALARIKTANELSDFKDSMFIIESASENQTLKRDIFKELGRLVSAEAVLATNTSTGSITRLGAVSGRPDQVVGMHFPLPTPMSRLVEVVPGLRTSDRTVETATDLAKRMGKFVTKSSDYPGFTAYRVLLPMVNEAIFVLGEGRALKEDIDSTFKTLNLPVGPLEMADIIGLDTCLAILKTMYTQYGDSKYRPAPLLVKLVDAGWLGRKNGRGFYVYE